MNGAPAKRVADADPSTSPLAKCARGFAQDDTFWVVRVSDFGSYLLLQLTSFVSPELTVTVCG
jgi:hypothetical protein